LLYVKLTVNGQPVEVPEGAMVSAAVAIAGVTLFRRSVTGEARAPLCGMGICIDARGGASLQACHAGILAGVPAVPRACRRGRRHGKPEACST
jgi:sarcosine oxidase subunit alpha